MKKLILILICISLFKTTALATKKENLNSINIINSENKTEKDAIKILDNVENFENTYGYNDTFEKLEIVNKSILELYKSFSKLKDILKAAVISSNTNEVISLEKYIITLMSALLLKEHISLAASSLDSIRKSNKYKEIDINLKNRIENFLRNYYKNCFSLRKCTSLIDKLFEEIKLKIVSISIMDTKETNNIKNEEKTKLIKELLEKEMKLIKNKDNTMYFIQIFINKFFEFYDSYVKSNFAHKISEEFKIFLNNLFKIINIEKTCMKNFNSLIKIINENKYELTNEEINILQETNNYYQKIKEIDNKKKDMSNVIDFSIANTCSTEDKVKYEINLFFESFKNEQTMIFVNNIKTLKNSLCQVDIDILKEINEFEKNEYDGEPIIYDHDSVEKIRIQLINIENFKRKFKKPFKDVKDQIELLNLEDKYKEKIQMVEEIFNNCEKIKQYYELHNSIINDLKNKNKIKIEYQNQLEVATTIWNAHKETFKSKKENFEKILKNLKCCTQDILKNEIFVLDTILKDLNFFYNNNIAYSKEKVEDCCDNQIIKDFKNIVREYHTYYDFFKKAKETFSDKLQNSSF